MLGLRFDICLSKGRIPAASVLPEHKHDQENTHAKHHNSGNHCQQPGAVLDLVVILLQGRIRVLLVVFLPVVVRIIQKQAHVGHSVLLLVLGILYGKFQFPCAKIQCIASDLIIVKVCNDLGIFRALAGLGQHGHDHEYRNHQHHCDQDIRQGASISSRCQSIHSLSDLRSSKIQPSDTVSVSICCVPASGCTRAEIPIPSIQISPASS